MSTLTFVTDPAPMHAAFAIRMAAVLAAAVGLWYWVRSLDEFELEPRNSGEIVLGRAPMLVTTWWLAFFLALVAGAVALRLHVGGSQLQTVMWDTEFRYLVIGYFVLAMPGILRWARRERRAPDSVSWKTAMAAVLAVTVPLGWLSHAMSYRRAIGLEVRQGELHVHYAGLRRTARVPAAEVDSIRFQPASIRGPSMYGPVIVLKDGSKLHGALVLPGVHDRERQRLDNALAAAEAIEKAPR